MKKLKNKKIILVFAFIIIVFIGFGIYKISFKSNPKRINESEKTNKSSEISEEVSIKKIEDGYNLDNNSWDIQLDYEQPIGEKSKIEAGYNLEKELVVSNPSDKNITYDLVWTNVDNKFKTQSDLLYSISGEGKGATSIGTSQVPVASFSILEDIKLPSLETHKYTLRIWYDKSKNSKDTDFSKFEGRIKAIIHK